MYVLLFVFGHATCRLLYFFNATRKSIRILQLTQVTCLYIITRALENFHYAKEYRVMIMRENDDSEHNINAFNIRFNEEVRSYKHKSIAQIIDAHGSFFEAVVEFTDWKSAMVFLEANRDSVTNFLTEDKQ
tara:strand:+ start:1858 stop:2250 length:393 start_codon:yes stop_codon:yes gene_type:complete